METDSLTGNGEDTLFEEMGKKSRTLILLPSATGDVELIREFLASRNPRFFETLVIPHLGWLHRLL
jgi:hypothetical protein